MAGIEGLHHVTAIAGEPQVNINFYAGVLGLRLVKLTVNFDDPTTYHLYYGDGQGHPGTIMTFFPWPGASPGRIGTGQLTVTSFAVPDKSLSYWREHLRARGVDFDETTSDFGEEMLLLSDPDGLQLELVSTPNPKPDLVWKQGPVPAEYAVHGFHHVTLSENGYERTASLLTDTLGFKQIAKQGNRFRYAVADGAPSTMVDLVCAPEGRPGRIAVGTVHHVAWRQMASKCNGRTSSRNTNMMSRLSSTASISIPFTSVNPVACCLRSRLILPALQLTRPWSASGHL